MIDASVNMVSPRILFEIFGDPREFDRFSTQELEDGDFIIIASCRPGAVYVLRTNDGTVPTNPLDGGASVKMVHLLLGRNAVAWGQNLDASIKKFVGVLFTVDRRNSPEMDGVTIPFWVVRKK